MAERLRDETEGELRTTLWAATEVLLGLYHPNERVQELTKEVTTMILGIRGIEESSVYQDIFAKGRAEGEAKGRAEGEAEGKVEERRLILLGLGRRKLGRPDERSPGQRSPAIGDLDRLNRPDPSPPRRRPPGKNCWHRSLSEGRSAAAWVGRGHGGSMRPGRAGCRRERKGRAERGQEPKRGIGS